MPAFVTEYPQFFTASIKGWYKLLEHDQYKDIIVNSLRFLAQDKHIQVGTQGRFQGGGVSCAAARNTVHKRTVS